MFKKRPEQCAEALDADFEQVFERYYPRVSRFFSRRGFSAEESQDLAQKTFLQIYKGWKRHSDRPQDGPRSREWERYQRETSKTEQSRSRQEQETSWIFTIALNIYRNEVRHSTSKKRDAPEKPIEQLREQGWEPHSQGESPEAEYLEKQRAQLLAKALDELPSGMRSCFELRFVHGLKYKEIAEVLQISIQSVKSQLHQARRRLEELLSGQ